MREAADRAQGEAALHRPLPRADRAASGRRPGGALPQSRRRGGRGRGPGARRGHVPEHGARRPDHRALGRHADLQLLRGGRRHGHGRHARDPRRRSPQQHAAADEHAAGARRHAAGVCARADDPRPGRRQALQAARRGERAAVRGGGLSAGCAAQLPGAPRLVARRPGSVHARGDDRGLRHPRRQQGRLGLQSREAAVAQPAAHDARQPGGAGAAPARAAAPPRAATATTSRCSRA